MTTSIRLWTIAIVVSALSVSVFAQEAGMDAPVVRRARDIGGRFEVDAFLYDVSVGNVYVEYPYSAHLAVAYHFLDWLSLEAIAGYSFISRETSFTSRIRGQSPVPERGIELPGLWTSTWQLGTNLAFAPIYGKVSFWSESQSHFQLYAFVPLMGEGISRVVDSSTQENAMRIATGLGGGFRLFAVDEVVFRAEIRHMFGFNPRLSDGTLDVASTTWLQLGVGYLF